MSREDVSQEEWKLWPAGGVTVRVRSEKFWKFKGLLVSRVHPLGAINVCINFNSHPFDSCSDISVKKNKISSSRMLDWENQRITKVIRVTTFGITNSCTKGHVNSSSNCRDNSVSSQWWRDQHTNTPIFNITSLVWLKERRIHVKMLFLIFLSAAHTS